MKNLEFEQVEIQCLDSKELMSVDGGNGFYQVGILEYGDDLRPVGAFIVGF